MDYKIVSSNINTFGLEKKVLEEINNGWVPIGSIVVYTEKLSGVQIFCQNMIKNV